MNRFGSFREYYEKELRHDLQVIDRHRKEINRRSLSILSVTAATILIEIVLIPGDTKFPKLVTLIFTAFVGLVVYEIFSKSFRQEYKEKIIARLARFVDVGLVYTPDGTVSKDEFVKSRIFKYSCDKYSGEDHFRCKIGMTEIVFSEVTAKNKSSSGSSSSQGDEYNTFFKGLFIIADFNKHLRTHTIVLPDTAEKLFGRFGQNLQSISPGRGELIRLEDPRFEKEFCVYGDDQVEARYILTPSLMERILALKRKWNTRVYLSFLDSKVYIAISMYKDLFELRPFKPAADYYFLEKNLRFLTLLTEIVEDLNLNTRIWSKK